MPNRSRTHLAATLTAVPRSTLTFLPLLPLARVPACRRQRGAISRLYFQLLWPRCQRRARSRRTYQLCTSQLFASGSFNPLGRGLPLLPCSPCFFFPCLFFFLYILFILCYTVGVGVLLLFFFCLGGVPCLFFLLLVLCLRRLVGLVLLASLFGLLLVALVVSWPWLVFGLLLRLRCSAVAWLLVFLLCAAAVLRGCLVACGGCLFPCCRPLFPPSCGLVRRWLRSGRRVLCALRLLAVACGLFGLRRLLRRLRRLCALRPVLAALLSPPSSRLAGRFLRRAWSCRCSARVCWPALGLLLVALLRSARLRLVVAGFLRPAPLWCLPVCSVACWVPASRLRVLAAASGLGVRCPAGLSLFRRRCCPARCSLRLPLFVVLPRSCGCFRGVGAPAATPFSFPAQSRAGKHELNGDQK